MLWRDIQLVPRTHQREDISHELLSATNAFTRREMELGELVTLYGDPVRRIIDQVVLTRRSVGDGYPTWACILNALNYRFAGMR